MRRVRATTAALTVVAALVLAGCSDDDPKTPAAPPPTSSSGEVSSSATVEPTENPVEPPLPDAAKKATEAGARAFVEYYFDLVNYAQATGEVKTLRGVSNVNCNACNGVLDLIQQTYRDGGHVTDANYEARINATDQLKAPSDPYAFAIKLTVHNDEHQAVDGQGKTEVFAASDQDYTMFLLWVADRWRLDVLKVA